MKTFSKTVAQGLLIIAAALSGYLAWQAFSTSSGIAGCGDGASCDRVLSSSWAKVFGLPVALIGSLTYLSAAFFGKLFPKQKHLHVALLFLIPTAAAWFIGVQVFAIGSVCTLCCAAHLLASSGAIILLTKHDRVKSYQWLPSAAGATAAVALFGLVQSLSVTSQKKTGATGPVVSVYELSEAPTKRIERLNEVALLGGQVIFKLDELPLVGVSRPKHVVVALTDYTCSHCRKLHDVLQGVGVKLGGEVAILKLPATRKGTDSAELHHHMLALWKVSPKMHWTLERDLIEGRVPATAGAVRAEVIRLVGGNQFAEASVRHNEWIGEQIANTRKVQDANRETTGKGSLPQVIVGSELVMGAHSDPEYYLGLVAKEFGFIARSETTKPQVPEAFQLEDGIVDVGKVAPGNSVPIPVKFTNQAQEPMEIGWLNMGANVGVEEFTRGEIDPEEEADITLRLTIPEGALPGAIERQVTVHTTSGHAPISFSVSAVVGGSLASASSSHIDQ